MNSLTCSLTVFHMYSVSACCSFLLKFMLGETFKPKGPYFSRTWKYSGCLSRCDQIIFYTFHQNSTWHIWKLSTSGEIKFCGFEQSLAAQCKSGILHPHLPALLVFIHCPLLLWHCTGSGSAALANYNGADMCSGVHRLFEGWNADNETVKT